MARYEEYLIDKIEYKKWWFNESIISNISSRII
jgi:hypothetical protein